LTPMVEELTAHYTGFEQDFAEFYPQLREQVRQSGFAV